jgi:hypothetical protein
VTTRLAWIGLGVQLASMVTSILLGRLEYYEASVHRALVAAGVSGCALALGSLTLHLVVGFKARRSHQDVQPPR